MDLELKQALDELKKAHEDFKSANDERIAKSDALIEEKTAKANAAIDAALDRVNAIQKRVDDVEIRVNREGLGGGGGNGDLKSKAILFSRFARGSDDAVGVEDYVAYTKAFEQYLRKGDKALGLDHIKAMSVGSDPDGGYWVTADMSGRIVKLVYETSPIRQIASVQTISGDALEGINELGEAGSGWVGEAMPITETATPAIGKWRIGLNIQFTEPRATQSLLDDAMVDVESWLATKAADKLARTENTAFVSGDGVARPRGFLTYAAGVPSATVWNVIEQTVSGASGAFAATNPGDPLITMIFAIKAPYRQNARWVMGRLTMAAVRKLKDGQGNYLWQPNFQDSIGPTLLGYPITEAEDMPALAANSLSIAFGDFLQAYQIVEKGGVRVLRDPFTSKPYVKFYTTRRVGGDVVNFEAIKLMKFST